MIRGVGAGRRDAERDIQAAVHFTAKHKVTTHTAAAALLQPSAGGLALGAKVKILASTLGPLANVAAPPPGFSDFIKDLGNIPDSNFTG